MLGDGGRVMSKAIGLWLFVGIMGGLPSTPVAAATVCVDTAQGLRDALQITQNNGVDDTIQIVRGTYHLGGNDLLFNSSEAHSLNIIGGYAPGCATRVRNAAITMLDGDDSSPIFNVTTSNDFELHFLTLQHGLISGSSGGAMAVFGNGAASQALLANVILRDSSSDYGIGGVIFSVAGTVTLQDNLITGISGPGGAAYVGGDVTVAVHLTNNTVTGNTATNPGAASIVYIGAGGNVPTDASNNIFWDNQGGLPDLAFISGAMLLTDNDYQRIDAAPAAGSSGNLSVDPAFAGSADFHLRATSPLLGIGTLTPPGGLTVYDLEGNPRTWNNTVDLGVYERGDGIFADGFDF
jgi:hypothetical protein